MNLSPESCIKAVNGLNLPVIGLGISQDSNESQLMNSLNSALKLGYRLVDCAFPTPDSTGRVLRKWFDSGRLRREDIFITARISVQNNGPNNVRQILEDQLKALQLDYVDLCLIHDGEHWSIHNDVFQQAVEELRASVSQSPTVPQKETEGSRKTQIPSAPVQSASQRPLAPQEESVGGRETLISTALVQSTSHSPPVPHVESVSSEQIPTPTPTAPPQSATPSPTPQKPPVPKEVSAASRENSTPIASIQSIYGEARPVDTATRERQIEERLNRPCFDPPNKTYTYNTHHQENISYHQQYVRMREYKVPESSLLKQNNTSSFRDQGRQNQDKHDRQRYNANRNSMYWQDWHHSYSEYLDAPSYKRGYMPKPQKVNDGKQGHWSNNWRARLSQDRLKEDELREKISNERVIEEIIVEKSEKVVSKITEVIKKESECFKTEGNKEQTEEEQDKNPEKGLTNIQIEPDFITLWKGMEKLVDEGLTKFIGVSNFSSRQMDMLLQNTQTCPSNLQVQILKNPEHDFCRNHGISISSYTNLSSKSVSQGFIIETDTVRVWNPIVVGIARAHHKTPEQILLRCLIQQEVAVILPMPAKHRVLKQYLQIFDFELSKAEMLQLNTPQTN